MAYTSSLAALIILSASSTSAFVQVSPTPPKVAPLHATEAFQRSLLASRLGTKPQDSSSSVAADYVDILTPADAAPAPVIPIAAVDDHEKFQRSLLEAKLAYDAIDAALAITPATAAAVAEPAPVKEAPVAVVAEPEPEPEPEAVPEPVVAAAAISEPKFEAPPKPVIPEPAAAKRVAKPGPGLAIVPVNEATVQFTAGTLGAAAGFVLGGPILGAVAAAGFNYLSRKEEDRNTTSSATSAKKIVDTASLTAINGYNFLAQVESENKVFDSLFKLVQKIVDFAKESDSPVGDAVVKVESTLGGIANGVEKLNDDYDIVGGAGLVLDSVGDLVENGVDNVSRLNDEYKLTERVGGAVKGAVDKATEK